MSEAASERSPQPPRSALRLGFRTPEAPEIPTPEELAEMSGKPIPSPASSPETTGPVLASVPESEHDEMPESPGATRSRGSSTEKVANPLAGEGLKSTFRSGVIIASHQAHQFLTRTQAQVDVGLYQADDEDAARIGDPLAELVARREGLGEVNPDTRDVLAAMMGLAAYATKQIQKAATAKAIDARAGEVQHIPEPVDL